jgi:hypothetical protein
MDSATPSPERIELSTMRLVPDGGGKIEHVTLTDKEVNKHFDKLKKSSILNIFSIFYFI